MNRRKFISSIHKKILILFLKAGYRTGGILFIVERRWIFVPTFLGMEDCSWTLLLSSSVIYLLVCIFTCLMKCKQEWGKDVQESMSVFMAQHRTQAREKGVANLLLKQRLQWGAANQVILEMMDGEKVLLRTCEAKQSLVQFRKSETWLRLKWEDGFPATWTQTMRKCYKSLICILHDSVTFEFSI